MHPAFEQMDVLCSSLIHREMFLRRSSLYNKRNAFSKNVDAKVSTGLLLSTEATDHSLG